ncbi:MAG: hypothetical protein GXX79_04130 [Actinomycetales bacterium]|nr:hypothetical protein [Actinomycetales bacterium]
MEIELLGPLTIRAGSVPREPVGAGLFDEVIALVEACEEPPAPPDVLSGMYLVAATGPAQDLAVCHVRFSRAAALGSSAGTGPARTGGGPLRGGVPLPRRAGRG